MASRISPISLEDHAPYRRLTQFAVEGPAPVPRAPVSSKRLILGLPARTPVLATISRRPAASHDSHLDAA